MLPPLNVLFARQVRDALRTIADPKAGMCIYQTGNFHFEQIARITGSEDIISSDVRLASAAVGRVAVGSSSGLTFTGLIDWANEYVEEDLDRVAVLAVIHTMRGLTTRRDAARQAQFGALVREAKANLERLIEVAKPSTFLSEPSLARFAARARVAKRPLTAIVLEPEAPKNPILEHVGITDLPRPEPTPPPEELEAILSAFEDVGVGALICTERDLGRQPEAITRLRDDRIFRVYKTTAEKPRGWEREPGRTDPSKAELATPGLVDMDTLCKVIPMGPPAFAHLDLRSGKLGRGASGSYAAIADGRLLGAWTLSLEETDGTGIVTVAVVAAAHASFKPLVASLSRLRLTAEHATRAALMRLGQIKFEHDGWADGGLRAPDPRSPQEVFDEWIG